MSLLLNRQSQDISISSGTKANIIKSSAYPYPYELIYATDTDQIFVGNAGSVAIPVQTLDMAVSFEDEVVTNNDEIVYNF